MKLIEGLGPKVFLQIRDKVHWCRVGEWSVPEKALQGPAQLYDETESAKCLVEMEMPILLMGIHIASITLKKHLTVPAY